MTTPLTFSGAPVPTASESPDWPASLLAFGNTIDDMLVLRATSQANRDTLFANVDAGTLVSCASLGKVWMKTTTPPTAAAWITIVEIGTPATSGVVTTATNPNFSVSSQWAQRLNGQLSFQVALAYSGPDIVGNPATSSQPGNCTDTTLCTLQSSWQPLAGALTWPIVIHSSACGGFGFISSGGVITLTSLVTSGVITSGNTVRIAATLPAA